MTTTLNPPSTEVEHENLQDLLSVAADGSDNGFHLEDSTGAIHKVLRSGTINRTAQNANVAEFLDSIIRKNAKKIALVLDMSDDITSRPPVSATWNFQTMGDFWTYFLTGNNAADALNLHFHPSTINSVRPSRNPMEYEYEMPPGTWGRIGILELMEDLYSSHKISISNLDSAASQIARKRENEEKKAERAQERAEKAGQNSTETNTNTEGVTESATRVVNYLGQITNALRAAKKNSKHHTAEYTFHGEKENEIMLCKHYPTGVPTAIPPIPADSYSASYRDISGNISWTTPNTDLDSVAQEIDSQRKAAEKRKNQKEFAETVDMEKAFSRTKFEELCSAVSKSRGRRGEYKLDGKNYFVHENLDSSQTLALPFTPAQYTVSYPGAGKTITTGPTLHLSDALPAEAPTTNNLITLLEGHDGIYDSTHDLDREHLLSTIKQLKGFLPGQKKIEYVINGHTYHMWSKKIGGLGIKRKYYAEVPAGEHGKKTVSAYTVEGLYDKIIGETQGGHEHKERAGEKPAEESKSTENAQKESQDTHPEKSAEKPGSLYDRSVGAIFGNGLLGKALIWPKNLIPEPIRASVVNSGIVGGLIYGGSLALGSTALSYAIVPAMTVTFAASMTNRFFKWRKWWPHNKEGDTAHGGGHAQQ